MGLVPDVEVTVDEKTFDKMWAQSDPVKRLTDDPQLRTAMGLVRGH